jgi:hypothetical protein
MRPPTPLLVRWASGLELAGGLLLQLAPFLAFASVPLLSLRVPVPGLFLHGGGLLVCGTLAVLMALLKRPWPGVQLVLAAASAGLLFWDINLVTERTAYTLGRLQLSLMGLNSFLAKVGAEPLDLMPRGLEPADFLGPGFRVAALGIALLGIGALLEVLGYGRTGKRWVSVLLACPRCSGCGQRVGFQMAFCPGCGRTQGGGRPCARCGGWTLEGNRFCPSCGHGLEGDMNPPSGPRTGGVEAGLDARKACLGDEVYPGKT